MVFEHLPANDESPTEPAMRDSGKEDQSSSAGGGGDAGQAGGEGDRKQWGEGEGAPIVELLQHKQLQTATYAVNDGNTGS